MFLRLKKKFRPIAHERYFELYDSYNVEEYLLNEDQYQLILSLDGSKTEQEILRSYDEKSQPIVKEFLKKLGKLGALERLFSLQIRHFPKNLPTPYLDTVLWDITSLCNLECIHCYVSDYFSEAKGKDLSVDEVYQVIDEMVSMNVSDISLTGGEPLIRKDIRDIIKRVVDSGIRLASLFTNGIAVTQDFVDFLKSVVPNSNKLRISHSLDGMTPQSNAVLRGDKMDPTRLFKKMINSIRMFVEAGMSVSIGTGIHRFNVHDIPKMYSFVKDLGVRRWRLAIPKPIGRFQITQAKIGADWDSILNAYYQLINLHLKEVRATDGKVIAPIEIEIEQVFSTELLVKTMNTFQKNDTACFYHKNQCALKANGDILSCGYFDEIVVGNVRNDRLRQVWESHEMQKIKHLHVSDITECQGCSLLSQCGTGCRAVAKKIYGTITAKDPYACHQALFFKEEVLPLIEEHGFTLKMSERCSDF